jgi:hypothetical protein
MAARSNGGLVRCSFLCWTLAEMAAGCGGSAAPAAPGLQCFPEMWEPRPAGALPSGTRTTTMTMHTDRPSVCRWGEIEGWHYVELPHLFDVTGGTDHSTEVRNLTDGSYYRLYAKCETVNTTCATPHDLIFFFYVTP